MATESQRRQNKVGKDFLKLIKGCDLDASLIKNAKKEISALTKNSCFLELLDGLNQSLSKKSVIKPEELFVYRQLEAENKVSAELLTKQYCKAEKEKLCLKQQAENSQQKISRAKKKISKLDHQLRVLKNANSKQQSLQENLQIVSVNTTSNNALLKNDAELNVNHYVEHLRQVDRLYAAEATNLSGSRSNAISLAKTPIDGILSSEETNLSNQTLLARNDFSEITDLIKLDANQVTPMSFCENVTSHSIVQNPEKVRLLSAVIRSISGYSARKRKLVQSRAKAAETSAILEKLEMYFSKENQNQLKRMEGHQSLVTELEGEIKRTKKEIAVKFDELEHVIEKGKKLENEKLLGGEYRQKLSKFRLFNKRQTEVKSFLIDQFSSLYLTWMLLEIEICHVETTKAVMSKLVGELKDMKNNSEERCQKLLATLRNLQNGTEEKQLISPDDSVMLNIFDSLVPLDDASDGFGLRKFANVEEAASTMSKSNELFVSKLFQYHIRHDDLMTIKNLMDSLCKFDEEEEEFTIEVRDCSVASKTSQVKQQLADVSRKLENPPALQMINQRRNTMNQEPEEKSLEKYEWARKLVQVFSQENLFYRSSETSSC